MFYPSDGARGEHVIPWEVWRPDGATMGSNRWYRSVIPGFGLPYPHGLAQPSGAWLLPGVVAGPSKRFGLSHCPPDRSCSGGLWGFAEDEGQSVRSLTEPSVLPTSSLHMTGDWGTELGVT